MGGITFEFAGDQVAADNAPGPAVNDYQIHYLAAGADGDFTGGPCLFNRPLDNIGLMVDKVFQDRLNRCSG